MQLRLIKQLIADLFRFSPSRTTLTLSLMIIRSVTSGAGLLLIIPLLQLIGVATGNGTSNRIITTVTHVFQQFHLPLSLQTILASYIVLICGMALIQYSEQVVSSSLQQQYTCHLRTLLHRQLLHAQWPFFLTRKMSDLLYSLTAQVQGVSHCNHQLLILINNLILTLVYTGLALFLSWSTTVFAIASAGFLLSWMLPLHQRTSQLGQHHLQQNQAIHHAISEQFSALKMIKSLGRENQFIDKLRSIGSTLEDQNQRLTVSTARSRFLYACGAVVLFTLLLDVALTVFHVPVGTMLLLIFVFARLLPMVSSLQQTWQRILHQLPAYQDVNRLLAECKAQQEDCSSDTPYIFQKAITLHQVSFQYPTQLAPIINRLSVNIPKNTTTAIMGPSGSGKSTLTDLIVGLLSPTKGYILIDDQRLTPGKALSWKKNRGLYYARCFFIQCLYT